MPKPDGSLDLELFGKQWSFHWTDKKLNVFAEGSMKGADPSELCALQGMGSTAPGRRPPPCGVWWSLILSRSLGASRAY